MRRLSAANHSTSRYDVASGVLLALLVYVFIVNAWVVDDAYITFRVIDNLLRGRGLVWNVGERVQVYTHPLWMFVVAAFSLVTHEFFLTSLAVSFILFLGSVVIGASHLRKIDSWRPALWISTIAASKAVIDFSSSGLENVLSGCLAAIFFSILLGRRSSGVTRGEVALLFLVAALAFVNRQDTLLIYVPSLLYVGWVQWPARRRWLPLAVFSTAPAMLWLAFSVFYYGFAVPNTAYAKLVAANVPILDRAHHGVYYVANSVRWDWVSYVLLATSLVTVARLKSAAAVAAMAGVCLYLFYVVVDASIATHMSGRFFSLPFFIAFLVMSGSIPSRLAPVPVAAILASMMFSPFSPVKANSRFYPEPTGYHNIIDTRKYVDEEGTTLIRTLKEGGVVDHAWLRAGESFRAEGARVRVGAAAIAPLAVGFFGYAAGPDKYIIDVLGLTDPLLAHITPCNARSMAEWTPGHFFRDPPDGYLSSIQLSANLIQDPDLRVYYDKLTNITRGRLFSGNRLADIVRLNMGWYDGYLTRFNERARQEDWPMCRKHVLSLLGSRR
jgi:arabinofuranosyltransferase